MFVFTQYSFVLCALLHLAAGGPAVQRPTFDHFRRPGFSTTQQSSTTSVAATVAQSSTQVTASSILSLKDAAASSIQSTNASAGALPPVAASIGPVTNATLTKTWGITRDGGGGGTIDGTHIINFSDTGADDNNAFVSNSIATTNTNGTTLTDYGTNYPMQQWPFEPDEVAASGHRIAIWPNTNIVSGCGGTCGYTVSNVVDVNLTAPYPSTMIYSTLANITLKSNNTPSVERLSAQMWKPDETNYGIYGLARARDGSDDIYLFAAPSTADSGLKVAKVAEASIADESKYTYWDGSTWALTAPSANDTKSNVFSNQGGIGTGDIFWSAYHGRWLAVFNDGLAVDDTFQVTYSITEDLTGVWSTTPQSLFVTPGCGNGCTTPWNYASHAYPDIDPSGKTLLLGWTYNGAYTSFVTVTWA